MAAAIVHVASPITTPNDANIAPRRPATNACFVTIAVSGPGITITSTEMRTNGTRSRCTDGVSPTRHAGHVRWQARGVWVRDRCAGRLLRLPDRPLAPNSHAWWQP